MYRLWRLRNSSQNQNLSKMSSSSQLGQVHTFSLLSARWMDSAMELGELVHICDRCQFYGLLC